MVTVALLTTSGCASPARSLPAPQRQAPVSAYIQREGSDIPVGPDHLRLLTGGRPAFTVIRALIDGAQTRIGVEMYEFGRPDLAEALVAARRRGVTVTVIGDPSVDVTRVTADHLRAAGVEVIDYPVRKLMIDHVKLLIVDSAVAVVGGINWGTGSAANHDFDVEVHGPAATNLERVFERDLVTCGRTATVPPAAMDPGVLVAATLPSPDIRPLIIDAIDGARRSLDLELFVLTDQRVVHALERAVRRGVEVHLLLDPSERPSDRPADQLRRHGVTVRLYRSHGELLHAKAVVADGAEVVVGSANWSGGGFSRNHELDLAVIASTRLAADMLTAMYADWAASAGMPETVTGRGGTAPEAG